jgi:hypothetical protein
MKEYAAAYDQLDYTVSEVDAEKIKRRIEKLSGDIEQTEGELQKLEQRYGDQNQRHLNLHARLPRINFKEAISITGEILHGTRSEESAAIFLLQNSLPMGGKWCIARIRELLKESTRDFKYYPVELTPSSQLNEQGLLDLLAQYINIEPSTDDLAQYAKTIIQKICGSLQSGSIVFIEFRGWEFIHHKTGIISWFINNFWIPLIGELQNIKKNYRKVKFIALIVADHCIPAESVPKTLCCTRDTFRAEKIIELPLQAWTREEVQDWLESFSGLEAHQIDRLAEKIYNSSNGGLPVLVYEALSKHLPMEG